MSPQNSENRIPELDGLRGTAIFLVVLLHFTTGEGYLQPHSIAGVLQRLAIMGWTGVDLFFVLSGFLIGGILMDARSSPRYFKTFYFRRFYRIIPIYYLWILLYVLVAFLAGHFIQAHSYPGPAPLLGFAVYSHFLFLQNIWIVDLPGVAGAWLGPTWSLAVEEQFYLVSPLFVRLLSRRWLPAYLAGIILAVPLFRIFLLSVIHHGSWAITVLTPCRADTLAVGMLAAVAWRDPAAHAWLSTHARTLYVALGFLCAGVALLWIDSPDSTTIWMQSIGYSWMAFFYVSILLLALLKPGGPIAVVMRMGWLRELGRVSYCIYLIHLVVNLACHAILLHSVPTISNGKAVAVTLLAAVLTYAIAKLSWIFLEHPLIRRGHAYKY
jgi:peptidoglycan/LPS O-acetylase OafA/YrhL